MKHRIDHDLDPATARKAIEKAFDAYQTRFEKYSPTATWVSDDKVDISFTAKGMTIDGSAKLDEKGVELELDVPFIMRPFKNKAMGVVEEEIKKWIAKAKNGELED